MEDVLQCQIFSRQYNNYLLLIIYNHIPMHNLIANYFHMVNESYQK